MTKILYVDQWSSPSTSISSDDEIFEKKGSPPPPPPAPSAQKGSSRSGSASPSQKKKDKNRTKEDEMMQLELKNVLTVYREKRKLEIPKTPEVYISQDSTPSEVQKWLKAKGFSPRIQKQLSGMNGGELFKLNRAQIEEYCGKEEGPRLDGQITISRNTSGYKTVRGSELRAILAKARAKVEQPSESPSPPPSSSSRINSARSYDDSSRSESEASSSVASPKSKKPSGSSGSKNYGGNKSRHADSSSKEHRRSKNDRSPRDDYEDDTEDEITKHFNFSDEAGSDTESDDDANKGTLGRMLKQKQREMLKKKK